MKDDTVMLVSLLFAEGNKYGNPGYGIWSDDIAPMKAGKWMAQDVIYVDGKPRGDKKGKISFKTKQAVLDWCKNFGLQCEFLENYTKFYTQYMPNEYHDWIRITKC
jgi:hypothetical protein